MSMTDTAWREQAECADADLDDFYEPTRTSYGLAHCRACPVAEQCLDWALETGEVHGILGGTTERQRAGLARKRQIPWPREKDLPSDRSRHCVRIGCTGLQVRESLCEDHLDARNRARRLKAERSEIAAQALRIVDHLAHRYGLTTDEVIGRSREAHVVVARNEAMAAVRDRLELPYAAIGRLFDNRDHSSVMTAISKAPQVAA